MKTIEGMQMEENGIHITADKLRRKLHLVRRTNNPQRIALSPADVQVLFESGALDPRLLSCVDLYTTNHLVRDVCIQESLDDGLAVIQMMIDGGVYNDHTPAAFFAACKERGDVRRAFKQWLVWEAAGVTMGSVSTAALTAAVHKWEDAGTAAEVAALLKQSRCEVRLETFNTLMLVLGRAGEYKAAFAAYDALQDSPHAAPDEYSYSALLKGLEVARQWSLAGDLYAQMTVDGVRCTSLRLYCSFLHCAGKSGDIEFAEQVFQDVCEDDGVGAPNMYIFNALINAHARLGSLERASALFEQLQQEGLSPDSFTYCALLSAAGRQFAPIARFEPVLEHMTAGGVALNPHLCTAIINCYRRAHADRTEDREAAALDVLRRMHQEEIPRTEVTYNSLIQMAVEVDHVQLALKVFDMMQADSVLPSAVTFSLLLRACHDHGLTAQAARFRELQDTQLTLGAVKRSDYMRPAPAVIL